MAKVYVSILPQPNYVCAVSLNLGGNSIAKRVLVSQSVVTSQIMERNMFTRVGKNMMWLLWFMLGLIWAWGLVALVAAVMEINSRHAYENADTPAVINTVQTIPVEVYKLERED